MGKIRVCCFCETWESGGIESFLANILFHMELERIEVDIVTARLSESVFTERLKSIGVNFYELSGSTRRVLQNGRAFRELLQDKNYDVVHFNLFEALALRYVKIAAEECVPIRIVHSHNTKLRKHLARPLKMLIHNVSKYIWASYATERWACSTPAAEFMFPKGILQKKGFQFIPNGIQTERFKFTESVRRTVRERLGIADNTLLIGNVGRLCAQKNQSFLLEVFHEIHHINPNSRLLLVGTGDDEIKLKEKSVSLGLSKSTFFYGLTDSPEALYWAMDVFAFPSLFEGLGIAAVEAQAAGLPVFCSTHVPQEARLTDRVKVLPLKKDIWVHSIIQLSSKFANRVKYADYVYAAGFDIETSSRRVLDTYLMSEVRA